MNRRLIPLFSLLLLLLLVACGGATANDGAPTETASTEAAPAATESEAATEEEGEEAEPTTEPAAEEEAGAANAFPVTIEHAFGEMTLEAAPERIVSIGYADQDILFALGINPVAVRYWFGPEDTGGVFPWAEEAFTGEELPDVLNLTFGELNYETILTYDPDLIVAVSSGITEEEYEQLAQIAPTLAQSGDYNNFGMPWDEAALLIGEAVGKADEAAAIVADVNAQFEEAAAAHPEFEGKDLVVTAGRAAGGYAIFSTQDARPRFFQDLGFAPQADLDELTGENFYADISGEQVGLLDRDVIVFTQASYLPEGADSITNDPLLSQLSAVQDGRYVILTEDVDGAFSFSSVLSLPYAIEQLVPQLAEAIGEEAAAPDEEGAATDAFPVTIEHAFGEMTLEAAPERIVSIGYADQDILFALGINPVAVRYWFGPEDTGGVFPWAEDAFTGEELPDVLNLTFGELNYETILTYDPDLIVAVSSGITEEEYEQLAQIAPTLAQSGDYNPFGMPWDEAALLIGEAVGKADEAAAIVADVNAQFEEAAAAHPEFEGKNLVVATGQGTDGSGYAVFSTQDARPRFFQNLGFAPQADLDELTGENFYADISAEQVGLLDRDVIVFTQASYLPEGADSITNDPLLSQLSAVQDGRYVILTEDVDGAFSFSSVLSLPYAIEQLVPQLAEAIGEE